MLRNSSASVSRGRVGFSRSRATRADQIHNWEFDLEPTSCRFAAGERIRLEIASSAFPFTTAIPEASVPSCARDFLGLAALDADRPSQPAAILRRCVCLSARATDEPRVHGVPQIEFEDVTKSYGTGRIVLQSVDLKIQKGEFVSIIGPSGCGKSTVLKLISGLTPPSAGTDSRGRHDAEKRARNDLLYFSGCDSAALAHRAQNVGLGLELEARRHQAPHRKGRGIAPNWWAWKTWRMHIRASFPAE